MPNRVVVGVQRRSALIIVAQVVASLILVALIVRYSLVAYLATANPGLALRLDANNPKALLAIAERMVGDIALGQRSSATRGATRVQEFAAPRALVTANSDAASDDTFSLHLSAEQMQVIEQARGMVIRAIKEEPLSFRAATLLGKITEIATPVGASEAARPFYERAARLSPRASDAIYWLMRADLEQRDHARVIERADTLLRTTSRAPQAVFPILAHQLETTDASEALTELVIGDPPWRDSFLNELPQYVTNARTPLTLLLALKQDSRLPTTTNLRGYLNFLLARQFHELAYYTWLQFLPHEQLASVGLLFNGSFETKPSGLPFDWSYRSGRGTVIDILPLPGKPSEHGLRIDFTDGRVDFSGVSQVIFLAPGNFVLTGRFKGDLEGKRGLRWRVSCTAPAPRMLAQTDMQLGPFPAWREFALEFTIPTTGCDAQRVHLDLDARSSSELLVRGTMWYDDIRLGRQRTEPSAR